MSNLPNDSDSTELAGLRAEYIHGGFTRPCTPQRLGTFARLVGRKPSDYGSHSKRWIVRFTKGLGKL